MSYWTSASNEELLRMGADPEKMPAVEQFDKSLREQIQTHYSEKQGFALIWLKNDIPIGHCNVNQLEFAKSAHMHLHIWERTDRNRGVGEELVKKSVILFFEKLQLDRIVCEPYAKNPAPNKTLQKIGFEFEKEYFTIPGSINFEQPVKRWVLTKNKFRELDEWNKD